MNSSPRQEPDIPLAEKLFDELRRRTADGPGVTRESYGAGEQAAHDLVAETGRTLGLEVETDHVGNTYVTLPGRERFAPKIIVGSHMDSVPQGGNFDGAAGVVSGLAALSGLLRTGVTPARDISVMAVRAEEGCWFPETWLGSRMALGNLPADIFDQLRRIDTGLTLAEHMADCGFDPQTVREGVSCLDPAKIACFLEVHIEQGPVLAAEGYPIGIVQAIMGGPRYRDSRILGTYAHAGGAPRMYRHDAVAALGQFITEVNAFWKELERDGHHTVFTFGTVATDPALHSFSRVPGEVRFCLDARGCDDASVRSIRETVASLARTVEQQHGVSFAFGLDSGPAVLPMDEGLKDLLAVIAERRGVPFKKMSSGAGHDAGAFIECGVPTAMLFIRNENGSHNPNEAMDLSDFAEATRVLTDFLVEYR